MSVAADGAIKGDLLDDIFAKPSRFCTTAGSDAAGSRVGFFDRVFVSNLCTHLAADPRFDRLLRRGARVTMETAAFLFPVEKKVREEFVTRAHGIATAQCGWTPVHTPYAVGYPAPVGAADAAAPVAAPPAAAELLTYVVSESVMSQRSSSSTVTTSTTTSS